MIGSISTRRIIAAKREALKELELKIWEHPGGLLTWKSRPAKWTAEMLKTRASTLKSVWAAFPPPSKPPMVPGHPVIGLLGEYDALPGMSQKVQTEEGDR